MKFERGISYVQSFAYWVLVFVCPAYGLLLADLPDMKVYKVFNVIGVTWNLLGLVTLSYLISTADKFQVAALRVSSFLFSILLIQVPSGLMLGGVAAIIFHYPSANAVFTVGSYLFWPGVVSVFIFSRLGKPKLEQPVVTQKQIRVMGGYFLFSGLLAQFFGAVFDLIDFNG